MAYDRVARFINSQVWAIREGTLDIIVSVMRMRQAGITLTREEVQARLGAASPDRQAQVPRAGQMGSVAVLPLYGVICPKMSAFSMISGGTSLEVFLSRFRAFRDDPSVSAIVIDCDTPGGSTFGLEETWTEIYEARDTKPIKAVVNPSCASAGLWLSSAAEEIICTPSGEYGSLGVFCVHEDWSKANELMGLKPTYISAGQYKVEGNPDAPISDEAVAYQQTQVNSVYDDFVKAVAKGRKQSTAKVKADYGQGRMLLARDALAAGMVDRLDTFDNVLAKLTGAKRRTTRAATDEPIRKAFAIVQSARSEDGFSPLSGETISALHGHLAEAVTRLDAIVDPHPEKKNTVIDPDENGSCPTGYEYDDTDGKCHLVPAPEAAAAPAEVDTTAHQIDHDQLALELAMLE